ncbi:asparaginyl-tRNA synthetase [Hypoxylon sp. FL1284]|nr:asparaginyl-tRNA synthetase [Hypoxylon sp. FL1284]
MNPIRPLLRGALSQASLKLSPLPASRAFNSTVPTSIAGLLDFQPHEPVSEVKVDGFVRSVRAQKRHHFVSLGDGSSLESLQAVVPADQAEGLTIGAAVRLRGSWSPSQGRGQSHELQVERTTVLGPSDAKTFPLQKKYQTPEYLRTLPHLRSRLPFNSTVLRFRSEIIASLTRFFDGRDFTQTHTPILTSSDCEGAGEVFHVSAGDSAPSPSHSASKTPKYFFRHPVYTTVSAQLHLEALSQAVGDVWTLSPTFRAEQSDTPRHLSEFYMLEAEISFADSMNSVMDLVEDMLRHISTDLAGSRIKEELLVRTSERSDLAAPEQVSRRWGGLTQRSWPRITYSEAIDMLKNSGEPFAHEPVWGRDLHTEHEKYIATKVGGGSSPVFVTNYPKNIKAFYMKASDRDHSVPGETVDCFDLLVPDFCEIAGGSMREHRLDSLLESMRAHGLAPQPNSDGTAESSQATENSFSWYLDLRRWGCPPHGGFGLGFDRLISYLSGVQTIHDTSAFPRWYGRCDC